jgi:tartrate-resistant acid phosphatase type 5
VRISLNIEVVRRLCFFLLSLALLCSACTPPKPAGSLTVATKPASKPVVAQWTPRAYPTDQVNFIAMGDWGSGGQEQKDVAKALASYVDGTGIQFNGLLTLGDNFYVQLKDVEDYQFQSLFEDMFDARRLNFPFYVTLGNHDYEKDKAKIELAYAAKHPDSRWKFPSQWYRLDLPEDKPLVTVLMLNSNKPRMTSEQWDEQIKWIDEQLSQPRTTKWTIACAHHPLFSNGAHGDNGVLQVQWGPIFKKHKLDFYLCGHDHDMQQLQVPNWSTTFVLAGGGGKKPTKMRRDIRGPFSKSMNGFSHLQLFEDRAIVHFVNGADAKVVHEIQRTRDGEVSMLVKGMSDKATTQPLKVLLGIDLDEKKEGPKDPAKTPASPED